MSADPQLILIDDGNWAVAPLAASLNAAFPVVRINGAGAELASVETVAAAVVCLSPSALTKYSIDRASLGLRSSNTVFVLPTHNNDSIAWLAQRGVDDYFVAPVKDASLWAAAKAAINCGIEASWEKLPPGMRQAMVTSRKTLSGCFERARLGQPLDLADVTRTCAHIDSAMEDVSLSRWLSTIRRHHDYTYRHCMMVCSTLARFAQEVGFGDRDIQLLIVGGILHDLGKAHIPHTILDKPSKLSKAEWAIMGKHPGHSRDILFRESSLDPEIVAMAVHHHEKLDGTGYPDGLSGKQISDQVRLMAIADVFSALVDERAYKPAMAPEDALNKMLEFEGHLDLVLVKSFKDFILDNNVTPKVAGGNRTMTAEGRLMNTA